MRGIAIVSTKGGTGKTTLSHCLALGAAWNDTPAYLMHTDDREPIKVNGRPYMFYDAREPETLAALTGAAVNQDGLCIIDSGGNRPEFDKWVSGAVDLVVIPVTPDPEAADLAIKHMERLEHLGAANVRYILNMVSGNENERKRDFLRYYNQLDTTRIITALPKVAAVKCLREPDFEKWETPPTKVNNFARVLFRAVVKTLDEQAKKQTKESKSKRRSST